MQCADTFKVYISKIDTNLTNLQVSLWIKTYLKSWTKSRQDDVSLWCCKFYSFSYPHSTLGQRKLCQALSQSKEIQMTWKSFSTIVSLKKVRQEKLQWTTDCVVFHVDYIVDLSRLYNVFRLCSSHHVWPKWLSNQASSFKNQQFEIILWFVLSIKLQILDNFFISLHQAPLLSIFFSFYKQPYLGYLHCLRK